METKAQAGRGSEGLGCPGVQLLSALWEVRAALLAGRPQVPRDPPHGGPARLTGQENKLP